MFKVTAEDFDFGWSLIEDPEKKRLFMHKMEQESPEFYEHMCYLNYISTKHQYKEEDSEPFRKKMLDFLFCTFLLVGTLYSSYGKKFPAISQDLIKEVMDTLIKEKKRTLRTKERLGKLNRKWLEAFEMIIKKHEISFSAEIYLYTLAETFLRAMERENTPGDGSFDRLKLVVDREPPRPKLFMD